MLGKRQLILKCSLPQIPVAERRGIRHHLIDVIEPHCDFSAGDFYELARAATHDILRASYLTVGLQISDRHLGGCSGVPDFLCLGRSGAAPKSCMMSDTS